MSEYAIRHGDCIEVMRDMPDNSIDSIVTDPPYGLGFMGKKWDDLPPGLDFAVEALRVLKPGGHMLAFGGSRTWHRLAVVIEDAGFEIRDSIAWLYGSGFPHHRAALKPGFEPVVIARKPFTGSLVANERAHGTGSLNINGCRIGADPDAPAFSDRWPANVLLDESQATALDAQSGIVKSGGSGKNSNRTAPNGNGITHGAMMPKLNSDIPPSAGGASRFFYTSKAARDERPVVGGVIHPTVKPLALMRWLVRLVTPEGGTVLDPFAGSGTTIEAALQEGFSVIGIEREAEYLPLIQYRINRHEGMLA